MQGLYNWYRSVIRNPKYRWWIILGTLVYLFSPLDISPDVFPIVGQIDDVVLVTLLVSEVSAMLMEFFQGRIAKGQEESVKDAKSEPAETIDVEATSVE
ncbi:MAG: DUF1232 domain-containing protein [Coleofasciculaceae cyanobacterium SM2_3_26]|nr:DUF1232 domain-containing protein [Coleofasciculaceae cyanobacterium SM2_3_26]